MSVITVKLWGTIVGYLGYRPGQTEVATFEYDEAFMEMGVQIAPLKMSFPPSRHDFAHISQRTFHGLPGIFADSLPDKFGNQMIDLYFAQKGIPDTQITALDRLGYIGHRSMGALEYEPSEMNGTAMDGGTLDIHLLGELADMVLNNKEEFARRLSEAEHKSEMLAIIRVGSSAGGARSKALVATDSMGRFYDGTVDQGGYKRYWLLKFDSSGNSDREVHKDPKGMTRVEYVYSLIARECGIDIPITSYVINGGDFHYLIERFDRIANDGQLSKVHYVSLAGMMHYDRDTTGAYSYEQMVLCCKQLGLGQGALTELFRRAVFNIVGRNQDDHAKNFGFLMDRSGRWQLAPAFDMVYSYDPGGRWTKAHQFSLSGKRDNFTRDDLYAFAEKCNLREPKASGIIDRVLEAFGKFEGMAQEYEVPDVLRETIRSALRIHSLRS